MMETVFFKREAIAYFLKMNSYNWQKYNEFIAAVIMSKLYSAGTDQDDAPIGFAINREYYRQLDDEPADLEKLHYIIDKMKEDDTPIDIIISHMPIEKIANTKHATSKDVWVYQIKRFVEDRPGMNLTEKLIEFLNLKIPGKYAKTNARLLLLFETVHSIDLPRVADEFQPVGFPFTHVQFICLNFKGGTYIKFGDIWPERNLYEGHINRFFE